MAAASPRRTSMRSATSDCAIQLAAKAARGSSISIVRRRRPGGRVGRPLRGLTRPVWTRYGRAMGHRARLAMAGGALGLALLSGSAGAGPVPAPPTPADQPPAPLDLSIRSRALGIETGAP